jgi:hypothetical protein
VPVLVLDACGTLHLKQLGALALLDEYRARDVALAAPSAVYGELVTMSLSDWVLRAEVERCQVSLREQKEVTNRCERRHMPGRNDRDAIALARRRGAVLFTHDETCAAGAHRCSVQVVDVCDLADFQVSEGWSQWDDVDALLGNLAGFAYQPADWAGTVEATVGARPGRARLRERLQEWLGPEA